VIEGAAGNRHLPAGSAEEPITSVADHDSTRSKAAHAASTVDVIWSVWVKSREARHY
jgi:hypothetical protein